LFKRVGFAVGGRKREVRGRIADLELCALLGGSRTAEQPARDQRQRIGEDR